MQTPAPAPLLPAEADVLVLARLRAAFGLSATALGRLLHLGRSTMSDIGTGRRSLPRTAYLLFARLLVALDHLPHPAANPPPDPPPNPATLGRYARACRARAAQLQLDEAALRTRAAPAARRLAVLPALEAALVLAPPDPVREPPDPADPARRPRWLTSFAAEAHETLLAAGPTAQARLALRRAGLLHQAALAERLLAGEALAAVVPPGLGAL